MGFGIFFWFGKPKLRLKFLFDDFNTIFAALN